MSFETLWFLKTILLVRCDRAQLNTKSELHLFLSHVHTRRFIEEKHISFVDLVMIFYVAKALILLC